MVLTVGGCQGWMPLLCGCVGTGRQWGLKIPWLGAVRVRFPPPTPWAHATALSAVGDTATFFQGKNRFPSRGDGTFRKRWVRAQEGKCTRKFRLMVSRSSVLIPHFQCKTELSLTIAIWTNKVGTRLPVNQVVSWSCFNERCLDVQQVGLHKQMSMW